MKTKQRVSDLKAMSSDQLQDELLKLKKEQFNLRFQKATGQLENVARVRKCVATSRASRRRRPTRLAAGSKA